MWSLSIIGDEFMMLTSLSFMVSVINLEGKKSVSIHFNKLEQVYYANIPFFWYAERE